MQRVVHAAMFYHHPICPVPADAVAQRLFFQHYLQPNELAEGQDTSTTTTTSITNTTETGYTSNISNISNTATSTPGTGSSLSGSSGRAEPAASWLPPVLQRLSAEANIWALASHAYWGVWALIQVG